MKMAILLTGLMVFAACTSQPEAQMLPMNTRGMTGMPCHQMGDGSWMGDCENGSAELSRIAETENPTLKAKKSEQVRLEHGDRYSLAAMPVTRTLGGRELSGYAYNEMIPGPTLVVKQGSAVTVEFANRMNFDTTVHWHGLRHANKDDGVPDVTQPPVSGGELYEYMLSFPDAGIYWYHPHIREDMQQDAGLAGNILVLPTNGEAPPADREELLVLDDILLTDGNAVPHGSEHATHALMGRFGNVMTVNGKTSYELEARKGDVIRFYITDVANVRPFNFSIEGTRMKLVGTDMGFYERERFVDSVIIGPAERYIVDVFFETEGRHRIIHKSPAGAITLGSIVVAGEGNADYVAQFNVLAERSEVKEDIDHFRPSFDKAPDHTLLLDVRMPKMGHMMGHPDGGIEWEDPMPMMNAQMTSDHVTWRISENGEENMDLTLKAKVGDVLKLRLVNSDEGMHPMQHPIHLHGQRFLVTHVDGVLQENLAWKDTVMVPAGRTVDILVDVTNPGDWMLHCHIAEHLEAGMMTRFLVEG